MDSIPQKRCADCEQTKPLTDFGIDRNRKDGHNPYCRQCRSKHKKIYRAAYRDRLSEQGRAYKQRPEVKQRDAEWMRQKRAANPALARQQTRDTMRKQRVLYPERGREIARRWRARNPEKVSARNRRIKAFRRGVPGSHTLAEWRALKAHYSYRCLCCGKSEPQIMLTEDHVIPVTKGGSDNISNIQPLCSPCNASKGNRRSTDYRPLPPMDQLSMEL
jgi:5-methylcytosine-specific restriction endonuclease McrA